MRQPLVLLGSLLLHPLLLTLLLPVLPLLHLLWFRIEREHVAKHLLLAVAHKLTASEEILLWMTPSEAPKALQASECSELLNPMRASCWISAQH